MNEPLHDPPRGATNGNDIEALGGDNGLYGTGWDWIIPNRVNRCLLNRIDLPVPKLAAPVLILFGARLGSCQD